MRRLPRRRLAAGFLPFLLLSGTPETANHAADATAYTPAVPPQALARATELARLLYPPSLAMAPYRHFEENFPQTVASAPGLGELEAQCPGMKEVMIRTSLQALKGNAEKQVLSLWPKIGEFYSREMSVSEIEEANQFFSSPIGTKLATATDNVIGFVLLSKEPDFDRSDLERVMEDSREESKKDLKSSLSLLEDAELERFSASSAGQRLKELQPQVGQLVRDFWNDQATESNETIRPVVHAAVEEYARKNCPELR